MGKEVTAVEQEYAIKIQGLTKKYGANKALDNIGFSVKKGEVMGFLGPNGAGKSTTMNILTGYLAASGGEIFIDGQDISEAPLEARKKIGYLPEIPPLYMDMTVKEYLDFVYELKGIKREDKEAHLTKIMSKVRIVDVAKRMIRNLSKGYRQRVGLAQALIGDPEILILDEPTVGLDPKQILEIRNVISELGQNRTVILSTHILQEVSAVCDSYTIINKGKIVAMGKIKDMDSSNRFMVRVKGDKHKAAEAIASVDEVKHVQIQESSDKNIAVLIVSTDAEEDIREQIFFALAEAKFPILEFGFAVPSLEELFMQIISGSDEMEEESENKEEVTSQEVKEEVKEEVEN